MKNIIYLTMCICIIFLAGCTKNIEKPSDNVSELSGKLSDELDLKISDDNSKIWLDNSHIEKVSLKEDDDGRKILVFITTEEGKTALYNATSENIGKPLTVTVDEHLLASPMVMAPIEDGAFSLGSELIDYTYLYNYLTDAKDKMEGVTPPDDLVSESM